MRGGRDLVLCASVARKWTPSVGEHAMSHALGLFSHLADNRAGSDLGEQADAHPVCQAFGVSLQRRIALGVSQDGPHPSQAKLVEGLIQMGGKS